MSNFAWWYYTLSLTCSLHSQWPLHYFKVTVVPNSFNWKFYVIIRLSRNFVGLLSIPNRSWIYHCFLSVCLLIFFFKLSHTFKGDDWHVSWFDSNFYHWLITDTVQASFLFCFLFFSKLCIIVTLLGVYQFISGLMILTLFQGHRRVRTTNCKLFSRSLSTVVETLYGSYIH